MRLVLVRPGPRFSVQDVAAGWLKGFRSQGVQVGDFRMDDRLDFYDRALLHSPGEYGFPDTMRLACQSLMGQLFGAWPDVLFVVSGFFVSPDVLRICRQRGITTVLLATESPYNDDGQLGLAEFYDLVLLNDPTNLDAFRERTRAEFIPHAYDPDVHRRVPADKLDPEWRSDFCFVGTGYPSRIEFFEQVDWSGIDAALAGNWQQLRPDSPLIPLMAHDRTGCIDNADAVDLYSATKVSANIYRREADRPELSDGWAMGPREVELAACGTFFLTEPRPENRQVLPMIPTFDTPEEFGEALRWWLAHPTERDCVARKAQEAVSDRTFTNHAARVCGWLDSLRG